MHRLFLDANVLFPIAYDPRSKISAILRLPDAAVVSSPYAAAEALKNIDLKKSRQLPELLSILQAITLVPEASDLKLPSSINLHHKDHPILQAAIACNATHLLTGDKHFRPLFGRVVERVLILRPGDYLQMHSKTGRD